jgi:hypothetical protein
MTALDGWGNFYVIVGSSAGALIGLGAAEKGREPKVNLSFDARPFPELSRRMVEGETVLVGLEAVVELGDRPPDEAILGVEIKRDRQAAIRLRAGVAINRTATL